MVTIPRTLDIDPGTTWRNPNCITSGDRKSRNAKQLVLRSVSGSGAVCNGEGLPRTIGTTNAHWATIAAFKFLTLTTTRSGEVRNATWYGPFCTAVAPQFRMSGFTVR